MQEHHRHSISLMDDNIYKCELCGIRIAVWQIATSTNHQEQFKIKIDNGIKEALRKKTQLPSHSTMGLDEYQK